MPAVTVYDGSAEPDDKATMAEKPFYSGKVVKTMDANGYTYICLEKDGKVTLVGFGHDDLAVAQPRVAPDRRELPADDHGGVEPPVGEDRRDHGGRCRLAVHARYGDGELHLEKLRQHLGPGDDGDVAPVGLQDFGVIGLHGRGGDDHVGRLQVGFTVAVVDAGPHRGEPLSGVRFHQVGAAD